MGTVVTVRFDAHELRTLAAGSVRRKQMVVCANPDAMPAGPSHPAHFPALSSSTLHSARSAPLGRYFNASGEVVLGRATNHLRQSSSESATFGPGSVGRLHHGRSAA
jgi:hypothetical protein